MSPTIRVDDEVFKALQGRAQAFVDSPNDVLRRLVGLNHPRVRPPRAPVGSATPEGLYRPLILQALAKAQGSALARDVLAYIGQAMNGRFKARDLEGYTSGATVWKTFARWERKNMVTEGLLKPDSTRGIWELTEKGWHEAKR